MHMHGTIAIMIMKVIRMHPNLDTLNIVTLITYMCILFSRYMQVR